MALTGALMVLGVGPVAATAEEAPYAESATNAQVTTTQVNAAALTKCPVWAHGYKGWTYCEMYWSQAPNNGEAFAVGTNFQIYHAWPGSGGWKSLGGAALAVAGNGAFHYPGGVETIGTDGNWWCRDHPWTRGWYRC